MNTLLTPSPRSALGPRIVCSAALATLSSLGAVAYAQDISSSVEKCPRKLGALAVSEPQSGSSQLASYGLGSPAALLRLMIQQSGCFDVVERGVAMQNLQQERALAGADEMRQGSNIGKGQLQAADFVMTPNIQIGAKDTGGLGGALFGNLGMLGSLLGGLKFKQASTSLLIADVRSGIQVASAEGSASKTDFGIGGWAFGGGVGAALGGYTSTPEGKVIAASLLDNYNKIVNTVRERPTLIQASSASADANAAASTQATASQAPGQMLSPKIANVKVFEAPSNTSKVLATLQKSDELVASGELKDGFIKIDAANASGWVQRTLVMPTPTHPGAVVVIQPLASAPTGLYGVFSGTYSGLDNGTFTVTTHPSGQVSGSAHSATTGSVGVSGRIDASGALVLTAAGSAGGATYQGRIDPSSGTVSGVWSMVGRQGGGSFSGQRQQ
ncbi:MAG: CsgG/HfaB family protein [Rhodoferax sp.]